MMSDVNERSFDIVAHFLKPNIEGVGVNIQLYMLILTEYFRYKYLVVSSSTHYHTIIHYYHCHQL